METEDSEYDMVCTGIQKLGNYWEAVSKQCGICFNQPPFLNLPIQGLQKAE